MRFIPAFFVYVFFLRRGAKISVQPVDRGWGAGQKSSFDRIIGFFVAKVYSMLYSMPYELNCYA